MQNMAKRQFDEIVGEMCLQTAMQIGQSKSIRPLLKPESAKIIDLVSARSGISRAPGGMSFLSSEENRALNVAISNGQKVISQMVAGAVKRIQHRSKVMDTISAKGLKGLSFSIPSGTTELKSGSYEALFLNKLVIDLSNAKKGFAQALKSMESCSVSEAPLMNSKFLVSSAAHIDAGVNFLEYRNELAHKGFDVSDFDRIAESKNLLLHLTLKYERGPVDKMDLDFTKSTSKNMSM